MKTLKAKINLLFLTLIGCSVLITGVFVALLLRDSYIDSLTTRLSKEGEMIARTIDWKQVNEDPTYLSKKTKIYDDTLDVRVAFVDANGRLMSDSSQTLNAHENQKKYPEIARALESKRVISFTQRRGNYIHAAFPLIHDGQVQGAFRLSLDLKEVNNTLVRVWYSLVGGLVVAFILAAFASSRIASSVAKPLEDITQIAVDITKKRFYRRVRDEGNDEVARLGQAINRMAYHLQKQMNTIRLSERRLVSVMESLESGLVMIDPSGKIVFANQSFKQMFGIQDHDLKKITYQEVTRPYDLRSLVELCKKKEQKIKKEIQIQHPTKRIYEVHLSPILEKEGISVVIALYDITAIRGLEQMRRDFVANVSHELKTPITSIRGFAETLLDGELEDVDTSREFLEIIYEESLRLQRLVADLLDLSRIESKKMDLTIEEIPVDDLIHSIVKTMEDQWKAKDQTVTITIESPFLVRVDVDSFRQILLNLLANAIAYTPEGGKIEVSASKKGENWLLLVKDTGIGIPLRDQARIFERFYRVDKDRSRASGGTGLGLAIVKHLVDIYKGKIEVQSEVGKGSAFYLTIPIHLKPDN